MQEKIGNSNNGTEKLQEANRMLTITVGAIGQIAEEVLRTEDLPEHIVSAVEFRAGRAIRTLVQNHMSTHLVGKTSVRGSGMDMGIHSEVVLDVDNGQLYNVSRSEREISPTQPLPDREWFRNWHGVLGQVTCLKYY